MVLSAMCTTPGTYLFLLEASAVKVDANASYFQAQGGHNSAGSISSSKPVCTYNTVPRNNRFGEKKGALRYAYEVQAGKSTGGSMEGMAYRVFRKLVYAHVDVHQTLTLTLLLSNPTNHPPNVGIIRFVFT